MRLQGMIIREPDTLTSDIHTHTYAGLEFEGKQLIIATIIIYRVSSYSVKCSSYECDQHMIKH